MASTFIDLIRKSLSKDTTYVGFNITLIISKGMYDWIYAMPESTLELPIMKVRITATLNYNKNKPIFVNNDSITLYADVVDRTLGLDNIQIYDDIQKVALCFQEARMLYQLSKDDTKMKQLEAKNTELETENTGLKAENIKLKENDTWHRNTVSKNITLKDKVKRIKAILSDITDD